MQPVIHKYINAEKGGFVIWAASSGVSHLEEAFRFGNIKSAGFVQFIDGKPLCFGGSDSLNIDSSPDDSQLMATQLGL